MMLPFGIQTKGFVVGALFAYFLVPWVLGMIAKARSGNAPA